MALALLACVQLSHPRYCTKSHLIESYEFGDVTKKVVELFADDTKLTKDREMIGMKSANDMEPSISEALDKWDSLSEKELQDGLDKIEQYVELVENEQRNTETKK